jgi:hypothetical protein
MTRLSRDKGSLQYDDRIDVLAMGAAYWKEQVELNREEEYKSRREYEIEKQCRTFMNSFGTNGETEDLWVRT